MAILVANPGALDMQTRFGTSLDAIQHLLPPPASLTASATRPLRDTVPRQKQEKRQAAATCANHRLARPRQSPDGGRHPLNPHQCPSPNHSRECIVVEDAERIAQYLTKPIADGCNVPLQLGIGVKGGADIAALTVNLIKHRHPDWAIYLNDLTNGFNTVTRKAIFRGLSAAGLDHLAPAVDLWYRKSSRLYLAGKPLARPSYEELTAAGAKATSRPLTAAAGAEVRSSTGCQQGDVLGPLLFALAIHPILCKVQRAFPSVQIISYLDDCAVCGPPAQAFRALQYLQDCLRERGANNCLPKQPPALARYPRGRACLLGRRCFGTRQ